MKAILNIISKVTNFYREAQNRADLNSTIWKPCLKGNVKGNERKVSSFSRELTLTTIAHICTTPWNRFAYVQLDVKWEKNIRFVKCLEQDLCWWESPKYPVENLLLEWHYLWALQFKQAIVYFLTRIASSKGLSP